MEAKANPTYRERYASFLLRWAKMRPALPCTYASIAFDRLQQKGIEGITLRQLYSFKGAGNMPENEAVTEVMEEIARQYNPTKILGDKAARKFLRTWEPKPGRKVKAAELAAA
jgi:hypothetical protein